MSLTLARPRRPRHLATAPDRDVVPEEVEFQRAMQEYKQRSGRAFPTWCEVLEVLRSLGYRRSFPPVAVANEALLAWSDTRRSVSCPARLEGIGATGAVVVSSALPPGRVPLRLCLVEPALTAWAEVKVAAADTAEDGLHRIELAAPPGTAWEMIRESVAIRPRPAESAPSRPA